MGDYFLLQAELLTCRYQEAGSLGLLGRSTKESGSSLLKACDYVQTKMINNEIHVLHWNTQFPELRRKKNFVASAGIKLFCIYISRFLPCRPPHRDSEQGVWRIELRWKGVLWSPRWPAGTAARCDCSEQMRLSSAGLGFFLSWGRKAGEARAFGHLEGQCAKLQAKCLKWKGFCLLVMSCLFLDFYVFENWCFFRVLEMNNSSFLVTL